MPFEYMLLAGYAAINLAALFVMGRDKQLSRRGGDADRIPEGLLFFWAAALGALGVFMGMYLFHHKTKKWYFQLGVPLLIIQNAALVYVLWQFVAINSAI